MIREESSLVVDCSGNWKKNFHKHKKQLKNSILQKMKLLSDLESMFEDADP